MAQQWGDLADHEIGGGRVWTPKLVLTGRRYGFTRYLVDELGDSRSTAWTYEQSLQRVERWTGKEIEALTSTDVRRFIRESEYHPSTKNGALVAVKAYLRFGLLEGWADPGRSMQILAIRGPKRRRRLKRPLTIEESRRLLDACRTPNEHRVVRLGLFQGFRISDSANVGPEDVWEDRWMFTSVKGDKPLELPIHPELLPYLDLIFSRSPTRDVLKTTVRSLAHYTGIAHTSHTYRHTFSRRLDDGGVQDGVAIELLGQEQQTTYRKHYAGVSWDRMESGLLVVTY
jgi:integrase